MGCVAVLATADRLTFAATQKIAVSTQDAVQQTASAWITANFDRHLFANHSRNTDRPRASNLLAYAFWNRDHFRVMHRLADGVRNLFHTGFFLVTANRVRNLLRSLLLDHFADLVGASLGASLGNHLANGVRHLLFDNLTLVANAIDRLGLNLGYPDLLAHLTWRALNTDNLAFARAVNASALARIPFPATWLSNALFNLSLIHI